MDVLLTAVSVRGSVERRRSAGVGGITLTSEPVSTRNCILVCVSLTYNRRLDGRPLSPRVSGLLVSLVARLLALPGSFTKLLVIPAEGFGVLGLVRVRGGGASRAALSQITAATSGAVLGEGSHDVCEA